MTTSTFSIAMATYNGERFLQEQLDSLTRQTLLPSELIACDDGSSDATVSILEAFAATASFAVRIYRNERNLGYGDNFLKAASLCQGDWIAFCDQDDVWREHKLARYVEVIATQPHADLLSHSADQVDANLRPLPYRLPDYKSLSVTGPLRNRPMVTTPGFTCCVRRSLLNRVQINERCEPDPASHSADAHDGFIYHVANTYGYIARIPDSLALYRRHDSALTSTNGAAFHDRSLRAMLQRARSYVEEGGVEHVVERVRQRQRFYKRVLECLMHDGADATFLQRTRDAVDYYGRMAVALEARAEIYREKANAAARGRAFLRGFRRGVYARPPGGCGLAKTSLARDLTKVLFAW